MCYVNCGHTRRIHLAGADPGVLCPTSYDYDGALTEAGDTTPKYMALRKFTSQVLSHSRVHHVF